MVLGLAMMIIWPSHSITSRAASLRQKRQNPNCPPGVWSCKWKTLDDSGEKIDSVRLYKRRISPGRAGCRLISPGIWNCNGRLQYQQEEEKGYWQMNTNHLQKRQNPLCPPGIWSCKKGKRNRFGAPEVDSNQAEIRQNPNSAPVVYEAVRGIERYGQ